MDKRLKDIISICSSRKDGKILCICDESSENAMKIPLTTDLERLDAIRHGDIVRGIIRDHVIAIRDSLVKEGDKDV